jgi:YVTN family beta-propeller protein
VQATFDMSCNTAFCHNSSDAVAGLDLSSYAKLSEGSDYGTMVVPFKPSLSHLYLHLTGDITPRMPQGRDPLSDSAQRLFRRWIEAGAPFDDGSPMYADVTRKAFVACQGENAVVVIDMSEERVVRVFDVDMPHSVLVDPVAKRLYVSRLVTASDNIQVYDTDTYQQVATGRAGTFPALMELSADRSQLWITNFTGFGDKDNAVRICDPGTLDEIVPGGITPPNVQQPHGLAVAPSGGLVYVTNILTDNVSVFTQDPVSVDAVVPLPPGPGGLQQPQQCVLSPAEDYLYVSALGSDRVYVMRTSDNVFLATVEVGDAPWHLTLSPDGRRLWVANWIGSSVSVIDVTTPESPSVIVRDLAPANPVDGERPAVVRPIGIAFTPDGSRVYVTNANDDESGSGHHPPPDGEKEPGSVAIFDPSTMQVEAVVEVPHFARFVSFLP